MRRVLLLPLVLLAAAYVTARLLRPWYRTWGSLAREREGDLPGDDLTPHARSISTRAVTINAPSSLVWRWLAQAGQERSGFFSYRWLENLARADMPKVEHLVPEWRKRSVGDIVWRATPLHYGGRARQIVPDVEPESHLVLVSDDDWERIRRGEPARGAWGFIIQPVGPDASRLIARTRYEKSPVLFDLAHFIMERRMLLGIKRLAEETRQLERAAAASR